MQLRVEAIVPTLALKATPLYALSILKTPLSDSLRDASLRAQLRTGFLTMDQTRRLVLLEETHQSVYEAPLVGIWASGVKAPDDPFAWAACVRFARMRADTAEVVTIGHRSFSPSLSSSPLGCG